MITKNLEDTFRAARKKWGGNGTGSTPQKTEKLVVSVIGLITDLGIKSVLDFGCGSFTWMSPVADLVDYTGVDIVPEVAEANAAYAREGVTFATLGEAQLPTCDLVFCRDVLAHLSHATALSTLKMLKDTGAKWLLCSNYYGSGNTSIKDGGFRPLNLQRLPFSFPEPSRVIDEGFEKKSMALWRFDRILL